MFRVTVLVLLNSLACLERSEALVFDCYPNETFKVENPGSYTSVFANNSVGICNTTWLEGFSHAILTGCGMDDDILIFFSNLDPAIVGVIGGNEVENAIFSINCVQIPGGGVVKNVSNLIETGVGEIVSKYFNVPVSSNIYENLTDKIIAQTVMVGTPIFWVIETEFVEFDLKPEDCWAYGGKVISPTALRKHIIADGCSLELELVDNFHWNQPTNGSTVRTVIYAFRFYGSEYITMQCQVRVCPRQSDACNISCPVSQRRRRMADSTDNKTDDVPQTIKLASTIKVVSNPIKVVGHPEGEFSPSSESTSIESEHIWLVLVWFIVKIS